MGQFSLLVLLALLFPLLPAHAMEDYKPELNVAQELRKPEFDRVDLNKDEALQPNEIKAHLLQKFNQLDLNGDGKISASEKDDKVKKSAEDLPDEQQGLSGKWQNKLNTNLRRADTDGDDEISKKEYDYFFGGRFRGMDHNRDGKVNIYEFRTEFENAPLVLE